MNNRVRLIAGGMVSTFAGCGERASRDGVGAAAAFRGPSALHLDEETASLYVGDLSAVRCVALDSAAVRFAIGHGPAGVPSGPGAPGDAGDDEECLRL